MHTAHVEIVWGTFATPFAGYAPIKRGSTHCFTLSPVNIGVVWRIEERHYQRTSEDNVPIKNSLVSCYHHIKPLRSHEVLFQGVFDFYGPNFSPFILFYFSS
jgi:hypothetical protein